MDARVHETGATGNDDESRVAAEIRQRRLLVDSVFEIAKAVPKRLTGPARRKLRDIGVSEQAMAAAQQRGVLALLSADANWNREHMGRAGIDERVVRSLSIRPIVFASQDHSVLTSYLVRRTTEDCAYRFLGRGSAPIVWRGETPETAIVGNPLELMIMVSAGWRGHLVALPAGKWIPWWSRRRAVKCARQIFALDGQNADLLCPGALQAEGLRLELPGVLA